jgi:hypothetical protein
MRKLFISYRSSDSAKVDKIAQDLGLLLDKDGNPIFKTWQDKRNLPPGSPNWWDAVVDAIIDCDVFVFNVSKACLQSEVCQAELDYAHKRNRPIISVVLEGEFYLDPKSGRYNINYWDLVPEWLRDVQFLFYVGTDFYNSFQTAINLFESNWPPDVKALRPMNPDNKSVYSTNHAIYDAACDYAERLAFADAEKHFHTLLRRNDSDYADVAAQWLEFLPLYAELIELAESRNTAFIFKKKWTAYIKLFPKEFLDGIFDPKGIALQNGLETIPQVVQTAISEAPPSVVAKPSSLDIMPQPFAWIEIPQPFVWRYLFKLKYSIAKYPVTNRQFAEFITAGGYREQKWWTAEGWIQCEKEKWTEPRFWRDFKWNEAEHPVVGVSWYEALAFCCWLRDLTGESILLPTEEQWQYAAQGEDGRTYPWGNTWNQTLCNNNISSRGFGKTSVVRHYEGKGDSAFEVVDMSGNVWEWCLTDFDNKTNEFDINAMYRVIRGGCWVDTITDNFRCDYRLRWKPDDRGEVIGFRLCRIP